MSNSWDLRNRTVDFAVAAYRFCRTLPRNDESREIAGQLRRAASSVASNYRAARRGRSHLDFTAKIGIVLEEADEALFWLEFLVLVDLAQQTDVRALQTEANELTSIFTAAQKTARRRAPLKR